MRLLRTVPSPRRTRVRRSDRVPFLELVEPRLLLANLNMLFTVNSAADDLSGPTPGIVTLRDAINEVNNDKTDVDDNFDAITFAISGTPTISLAADLPAITGPVFIDGESQPGYSGTPLIQIDGHGVQLWLWPDPQPRFRLQHNRGTGYLRLQPGGRSSHTVELQYHREQSPGDGWHEDNRRTQRVRRCNQRHESILPPFRNTFTDCTFSGNSLDGAYISISSFNRFTHCIFHGNSFAGAYMSGEGVAGSNTFSICTFSDNSVDGVFMSGANSNTFDSCTFSGSTFDGDGDGVYMTDVGGNSFDKCTFSDNSGDGVFMSSAGSEALPNTFDSCTFSENMNEGVYISTAIFTTFTGCNFTGNMDDGVFMDNVSDNSFDMCTISDNKKEGVFMSRSGLMTAPNTFADCTFSGNSTEGVDISRSIFTKFTDGCNFTGNGDDGVFMSSDKSNTFTDGCTFSGNSNNGVFMLSVNSTTFTSCIFSGNMVDGVYMTDVGGNSFDKCTFSDNSADGVFMSGSDYNTVTGCTISGNNNAGIEINSMSEFNVIDENHIFGTPSNGFGTPSGGSSTQQAGILINDSIDNTIGGTTAGSTTPGNVIWGNNVGIQITGFNSNQTGGNVIEGNYIGVAEDGSAIGNLYGIWINDVPSTTIGGTTKGAGNTISDNKWAGVYISGLDATGNLVEGNSILGSNNKGTKTSPTNPRPIGVFIQNSSSNTIGGAGAGNTISGNNVGVYIVGTAGSSTNNQVLGNFIGLSAKGGPPPGNVLYGVILVNAPNNNVPQSGPSANKIVGSGIANFREFSGSVAPTTRSSSGSKAKKPAHHSNHVVHQSPRRTASHALVTVHGQKVPAGPLRKPRDRVRH